MRQIVATLLFIGFLAPAWAHAQHVTPVRAPAKHGQPTKPLRGTATVYATKFVGRRTADGEHLDRTHLTAAHRSLPFGTIIEVTNRKNGRKAKVRINDRGPYRHRAVIDLSPAAAAALGIGRHGSAPVELRVAAAG
ncbi:MAG TPA: septal ring lytic transglycosylase RlpA family protein [Stellaceae bacterium]|jgi:rare lipoprotein A